MTLNPEELLVECFGKNHQKRHVFVKVHYVNDELQEETCCISTRIHPENRHIFKEIADAIPGCHDLTISLGCSHTPIFVTKEKIIVRSLQDFYCALVCHLYENRGTSLIDVYVPACYFLNKTTL